MPDSAFFLDQLTPAEALSLLARNAAHAGSDGRFYRGIRVLVNDSVFGTTCGLMVPEAGEETVLKGQRARLKALTPLLDAYRALKNVEPGRRPSQKDGFELLSGIAWLLCHSLSDDARAAEPMLPEEFLLVGRNLREERVAEMFEDLRFHATHSRVAGGTSAGDRFHLFHVLDDRERRSSFLSAAAGDAFKPMTPLIGYATASRSLFLPPDMRPDREALLAFEELLVQCPGLVGQTTIEEGGMLAALSRDTDNQSFHFYFLANLSFFSQARFSREADSVEDLHFHGLEDSPNMLARLHAQVRKAAPDVGYKLELRPMSRRDAAETARMRLLELQNDTSYKLAYLDSVSRPRPLLLCFTERMLPALAELIRAFPQEVLQKGHPRYAFQAREGGNPEDAAGTHYLYLEPQDALYAEHLPLAFRDGPGAPIRYWLDPFWARYYHGSDSRCLVFVPESLGLFPPMHGWDAAQMDSYLREVMMLWFGDREMPELPQDPLYIFDGDPKQSDSIAIHVLDQARFQPLRTRLAWINDHLTVTREINVDRFVERMADSINRARLAQDVSHQAEAFEKKLEETLLQANRVTAGKLAELSDVVTGEMNHLLRQTNDITAYLKELFDYLQELVQLGRDAEQTTAQSFRSLVKTEGKYRDLGRFIERLELDIDKELLDADKARTKMINKVTRAIEELSTTHDTLREKLLAMWRLRG